MLRGPSRSPGRVSLGRAAVATGAGVRVVQMRPRHRPHPVPGESHRMRLLITGGRGMVGGNLARGLAEEHEVWAPGRDELDLLDAAGAQAAVGRYAPELIVHAAGRVGGIAANAAANALFLHENTLMGLNLLEA